MDNQDLEFLGTLECIIRQRLGERSAESYTATLAASGQKRIAQKVGEEAVELALAATGDGRAETIDEAADLVYHLLLLLNNADIRLRDVVAALEARHRS